MNTEDDQEGGEEFPTAVAQPTTAQLKATAKLVEDAFIETALPSLPNSANDMRPTSVNSPTQATGRSGTADTAHSLSSRSRRKKGIVTEDDDAGFGTMDMEQASGGGGVAISVTTDGAGFAKGGVETVHTASGLSHTGNATLPGDSRPGTAGTFTSRPGTGLPKAELVTRISSNPLSRSTLLPPPMRPKAGVLFPRQPAQPMDAQSVSPLMQVNRTRTLTRTRTRTLTRTPTPTPTPTSTSWRLQVVTWVATSRP